MHKKTIFSILLILFLIPTLISATTLSVKGKSGCNLTVNILNPANNESITVLTGDIGSTGQVNLDFSAGNAKVNIIIIARVNGKIIKKKEVYNANAQSPSPIIIDLIDIPPAPKPTPPPIPTPTPPAPAPTPPPAPTPAPTPAPETKENKTSIFPLTGMAISLESIKLSPTAKKIVIYSIIGIFVVIVLVVAIILFILRIKKRKNKSSSKDFKITKLSNLKDPESEDDIEEAEKRLKVARDEISRINEILNKRRAIKEAEKRLEEERRALERLKKRL